MYIKMSKRDNNGFRLVKYKDFTLSKKAVALNIAFIIAATAATVFVAFGWVLFIPEAARLIWLIRKALADPPHVLLVRPYTSMARLINEYSSLWNKWRPELKDMVSENVLDIEIFNICQSYIDNDNHRALRDYQDKLYDLSRKCSHQREGARKKLSDQTVMIDYALGVDTDQI